MMMADFDLTEVGRERPAAAARPEDLMAYSIFLRVRNVLSVCRSLLALTLMTLFFSLTHAVPSAFATDAGAHCEGQQEPTLRASALQSNDSALSERYLTCFAYGDGVISVKQHQTELREAQACTKAKSSDDLAELRNFVINFSSSPCAPDVAKRLQQVQNLKAFTTYDNTNFIGTVGRRGTTEGEVPCANACQVGKAQCAGYSYDAGQKACTLWSSIQNRGTRGNTKSGAFSPVPLVSSPAPVVSPPPVSQPAQPAQTENQGMRYLDGADIPGGDYNDIRDISIQQCNAMCASSSSCAAFTFNTTKNACFLKGSVGRPIAFPGAVSGIKPGTPIAPTYNNAGTSTSIMQDMDLPNDDTSADYALLRGVSLTDCQRMCVSDGKCAAFTYNQQRNACILKSSFSRSQMFLGAISGVKQ